MMMIVTDRFDDGDSSNNAANGAYAPREPGGIHGGDLAGIEARLPYLKHLGITAIWMTPVAMNVPESYHGYWIQDLMRVDPRLGTMDDLRRLIRRAHALGIRVYLDIVCNHLGPLSRPVGGAWKWNPSGAALEWADSTRLPSPAFFRDLSLYHPYGEVECWQDPDQIIGELPGGLDDLKTELPAVREELIRIYLWWLEQTGCDGFRVDTVKHVEREFWYVFLDAVRHWREQAKRPDLTVFGEVFAFDDETLASYTWPDSLGRAGFDAVLNFSLGGSIRAVFGSGESVALIARSIERLSLYHPSNRPLHPIFIDNHDLPRFLHLARGDRNALQRALTVLFTAPGPPILYYGTEQGFLGGDSHEENREDQFAGDWKGKNPPGVAFADTGTLFRCVQNLAALRAARPELRRGTTRVVHLDASRGLLVIERRLGSSLTYVCINQSTDGHNLVLTTEQDLRAFGSGQRYQPTYGVVHVSIAGGTVLVLSGPVAED